MKKLPFFGLLLILGAILAVTGCGGATTSTTSTTTITAIPPVPIEIISVVGPVPQYIDGKPMFNPGGPVVEITLKNVTAMPYISLNATLKTNREFYYTFDVTNEKPLLPGQVISARQAMIRGGFSDNVYYSLTINAILQNGDFFNYSKQIKITPPGTYGTQTPTSSVSPSSSIIGLPAPISIVSVAGPIPVTTAGGKPVWNPGGPSVEVILKNISSESVISLEATLRLGRDFYFSFNVTSSSPLLPGQTASAGNLLIGGSIGYDGKYPLAINGTLQNGASFAFDNLVQIVPAQ